MKTLTVIAAGFGYGLLEREKVFTIAGVPFGSAPSVFPAVTCVAQATLRTGLDPHDHWVVSNGCWSAELQKPLFWEQSARIVKGARVWDERRAKGGTVGLFFLQQSLGERADAILSPAPIHKHGGGMVMSCYTKPTELAAKLVKACGTFPLWRYWGPLASPKVGRACVSHFEKMIEIQDVDEAYLYLPTLDYAAQKHGPGSAAAHAAFVEFCRQLERLADLCQRCGAELKVLGDYEITPVMGGPVRPNVILREKGFFRVRAVGGRAYPDFYQSTAFAMCDHEFCVLYGTEAVRAKETLLSTGLFESADGFEDILLARKGSWCEYVWWTDRREAPDYASHVDIHNKPGFDPKELFFFNRGTVKGTHGRASRVAISENLL